MVIILIFLSFLIILNIRKKTESDKSTLMRILTNYLQVVSTALGFGASFPGIMNSIFMPVDMVGSSSDSFVSFDCFLQDQELKLFAPSSRMFQLFLTFFLPIIIILLYALVWVILYFAVRKWCTDLKRNIVVSSVVILFLLHPTVTKAGFSIFQCVEVDEGDYRVKIDLDMK